MSISTARPLVLLLALGAALGPALGAGDEPIPLSQETVRIVGPTGTETSAAPIERSDVERYCTNIADPAREAREAVQSERLRTLQAEVDVRIDELEKKRAEYQTWLEERRAFLESSSTIMLEIYAAMKPDAAAAQLAGLDRQSAAAIVARLKSRQASAILAEMPAPVAAELATMIVNRVERPEGTARAEARS